MEDSELDRRLVRALALREELLEAYLFGSQALGRASIAMWISRYSWKSMPCPGKPTATRRS